MCLFSTSSTRHRLELRLRVVAARRPQRREPDVASSIVGPLPSATARSTAFRRLADVPGQ